MSLFRFLQIATIITAASCVHAGAASLQVSPVNIDVKAPAMATTLTLRNFDVRSANTQIRIFKWVQKDGKDVLEPTQSVVASPPAATLKPGTDYTVRIVRVDHSPVSAEESYRLLVDQIPDPATLRNDSVNFGIRYSIPVFFSQSPTAPQISWSARVKGGQLQLIGSNMGERRLKVSNLSITNANGQVLNLGDGLLGYILGMASMQFKSHAMPHGFVSGSTLSIEFKGDDGPVKAIATVQKAD